MLSKNILNKRILVTGAAGSIGSELIKQLWKGNDLYCLDLNEMGLHQLKRNYGVAVRVGDIRNKDTLRNVFDDFRPEIVFHAAAYKSVDMMEYVPEEAIYTNVVGTMSLIEYSKIYEVEKFVFISTDKAVNAKSIMGKTKSLGETMTINSGKGYCAVRFGNVLGSRGSLLEIWEEQLNKNQPLTITEENMERYFMTIPEAVNLVIEASRMSKGGEIICFEMGNPVKIKDLALGIIKELGRGEVKTIGNRGGESLTEVLMTEEERKVAKKVGNFYVIK
jgi:FlaA1/EpsC-like NDP-sugar epimerase